jgi:hypothetical protein
MTIDPSHPPLRQLLDTLGKTVSIDVATATANKTERLAALKDAKDPEGLTADDMTALRGAVDALTPAERTLALQQTLALIRMFRAAQATGPLRLGTFATLVLAGISSSTTALDPAGQHVEAMLMKDNSFKQARAGASPRVFLMLEAGDNQTFDSDEDSTSATGVPQALDFLRQTPALSIILISNEADDQLHVVSKDDPFARAIVDRLADPALWDPQLVTPQTIHHAPSPLTPATPGRGVAPPVRSLIDRTTWSMDALAGVHERFSEWLSKRNVVVDGSTQLDLLSAFLSTQFLLFAGPSGTGKSTPPPGTRARQPTRAPHTHRPRAPTRCTRGRNHGRRRSAGRSARPCP